MSNTKEKRVRRLVDSEVQIGLARRIIFHWIAFLAVASAVGVTLQFLSDPFRPMSEQLRTLYSTYAPFLLAMLVMLPVFVVDSVKFSLRFAGPIVRLRRVVSDLAQGKPVERLTTRKNDFWRSTIEEFNTLIDRVKQQADARG